VHRKRNLSQISINPLTLVIFWLLGANEFWISRNQCQFQANSFDPVKLFSFLFQCGNWYRFFEKDQEDNLQHKFQHHSRVISKINLFSFFKDTLCLKLGIGWKTGNNNEIYHICEGTRQKETHWKLLMQDGRKGWESELEEGLQQVKCNACTGIMPRQKSHWKQTPKQQKTIIKNRPG
jgi:hypothetical protein